MKKQSSPAQSEPIALKAVFNKAQTLVDGGWRVSFDLPTDMGQKMGELTKVQHEALFLVVLTGAQAKEWAICSED